MTSRPKESEKRQPNLNDTTRDSDSSPSREEDSDGRVKFTPEKVALVAERIRGGTWMKTACQLEGVTLRGLEKAMDRDESIAIIVNAARAENTERLRTKMESTLFDWKREAWALERWDRDLFKPPKAEVESKNEHAGPGGSALTLTIDAATAHALAKLPREPK